MNISFSNTHEDEKILKFLDKQVDDFTNYLEQTYPTDERTKRLISKLCGVGLLPFRRGRRDGSYNSGMFDHSTGILYISPRDGNGNVRSQESLNRSIVHELGHGTRHKYPGEKSHSIDWESAWKFFLKIATNELGWRVEAPCSSMVFYGLTYDDCQNCVWETSYCPTGKRFD